MFHNVVVVGRDGPGKGIVVGYDLAGGHHEVVADGGMGVGVILGGEPISPDQTIEIGHGGIVHHAGVAVVLFHHHKYMAGQWHGGHRGHGQ